MDIDGLTDVWDDGVLIIIGGLIGVVMDVLRTMFVWFNLPWRDLTDENMFEKAKLLKQVDKHAIRFSKFA